MRTDQMEKVSTASNDLLPTTVGTTAVALVDVAMTDVSWTPTGDMSFEQWEAAGRELQRMGRSVNWWIGDWVLYGERHYGETYDQAIDLTGMEYGTLANIVSVARRVDQSSRRNELSWTHHVEVASLEPSEQAEWLDRAEQEGMTVARLRSRLQGTPKEAPDPSEQLAPTHIAQVRFKFVAESDEHGHERVKEICAFLERKGVQVSYKHCKALG